MNGRVRALERVVRLRIGCPTCRGRELLSLAEDAPWPAWLDDGGRCRACGRSIKLVSRDAYDAL